MAKDRRGKTVLKMTDVGQDLSLVGKGAVEKPFHFQKSKGGVSMDKELLKALKEAAKLQDETEAYEVLKAKLGDEKKATAALAALRLLQTAKGEDGFPDDFLSIISGILGVKAEDDGEGNGIDLDTLPENQRAYVEKLMSENQNLKTEKEETDAETATAEHIEKAKGFPTLFDDAESVGPVLQNLSGKLSAEEFGWLENIFTLAEKQSADLETAKDELETVTKDRDAKATDLETANETVKSQAAIIAAARGESTAETDPETDDGTPAPSGSENNEDLWGGIGLPDGPPE